VTLNPATVDPARSRLVRLGVAIALALVGIALGAITALNIGGAAAAPLLGDPAHWFGGVCRSFEP
jgi:hypothetical protein